MLPTYLHNRPAWLQKIHLFWFGEEDVYAPDYTHRFRMWYRGGPALDAEILSRFDALAQQRIQQHQNGTLAQYLTEPRASLVTVILLDQMTRNMYRGSADMFASDSISIALVYDLLETGGYDTLAPIEQLFCCVALEHSEQLDDVQRSASLMKELAERAPAPQQKRLTSMCTYNQQHLDIIEQFGRYPHRNELLGRTTTPKEAAFLKQTKYRFMRSVKKGYK